MDIGFMQGRLSPQVDGKIQAFPWQHWQGEFDAAAALGFPLMEWTLDEDRLAENPLMTADGRERIRRLSQRTGVRVRSLTGDFLMQAPPLEAAGIERERRLAQMDDVIAACGDLGIRHLVWPLVDNGRMTGEHQASETIDLVTRRFATALRTHDVQIAFEADLAPAKLAPFIAAIPVHLAGVNYDSGNSASLGFSAREELAAYGHRVVHVHVKDRLLGGTTVPLGTGNADFAAVFEGLRDARYTGVLILQTARAADGDHAGALVGYRTFVRAQAGLT